MGKHVFTLSLRAEFESSTITNGESARTLELPPQVLHSLATFLRNEWFELETMTAEDFNQILPLATKANHVLLEIENLVGEEDEDDEDDDDDE